MRSLRVRVAVAALLLGAGLGGCELFINGKLDQVSCTAEGTVGPPACPDGLVCLGGACLAVSPDAGDLGLPCQTSADCAPGDLCLDPASFGGAGTPSCSRLCCSSDDCDPEGQSVCWAAPVGGASFCRPASLLGRSVPGAAQAGDGCQEDGDCRSGVCACSLPSCGEKRCFDTCCSDTDCAAGTGLACTLVASGPFAGSFACGPDTTYGSPLFHGCSTDADCASGLCVAFGSVSLCSAPCCGSASCGAAPGLPGVVACAEVDGHGAFVRACSQPLPETASAAVGDPCSAGDACRSGLCLGATGKMNGYCTDLCCIDADCGDPSAFACLPSPSPPTDASAPDAGAWVLRCTAL
jgi:hypothetical protein